MYQVEKSIKERENSARKEFPAPIGKLLGLTTISSEAAQATVEFQATRRYANPMGTLHGGVLCDIADAAMGMAYRNTLAEDESFTTLELKINFLRPVWSATLRAKARVIRAGRLVGVVECDVIDERERLVARASSTCMVLRGQLAEGRRPQGAPNHSDSDDNSASAENSATSAVSDQVKPASFTGSSIASIDERDITSGGQDASYVQGTGSCGTGQTSNG
jgi:uncharacterized protein (TIGR00369 family)